jgi:hypothetical protein
LSGSCSDRPPQRTYRSAEHPEILKALGLVLVVAVANVLARNSDALSYAQATSDR